MFSGNLLEAAPARKKISIDSEIVIPLGGAVVRAVSTALHHGALQNLETFSLYLCTVDVKDFKDFMDALEKSGCAKRLANLAICACGIDVEGVRVLVDLVCRGVFPAIACLDLGGLGLLRSCLAGASFSTTP